MDNNCNFAVKEGHISISCSVSNKHKNQELLRIGIMAEMDAINLYEQMADCTDDKRIKKVMLDIAREEKTHIGEFQTLLLDIDKEQKEEMEIGRRESLELIEKI